MELVVFFAAAVYSTFYAIEIAVNTSTHPERFISLISFLMYLGPTIWWTLWFVELMDILNINIWI